MTATSQQSTVGILFVHGLYGSPHEFNDVAQTFHQQSIVTRQVTLPGHGDNPEQRIETVSITGVLDSILNTYDALAQECDSILIVGHSLGAASALIASANHLSTKTSHGLCLFSTPVSQASYTQPTIYLDMPMADNIKGLRYVKESHIPYKRPTISLKSLLTFYHDGKSVLKTVEAALPKVTAPVWLCHGRYDMIVPHRQMTTIAQKLVNSPTVSRKTLYHCGHQVFPTSRQTGKALRWIHQCHQVLESSF